MGVETIEVSEAFRPQSCPSCEYSLAGHPPAGVCPECGESYDTDTIELIGVAQGSHVTISNASPSQFRRRFLPWLILVPIFAVPWAWIAIFDARSGQTLVVVAVYFLLASMDYVVRLIRRFTGGPAATRVRMNSAGIMQDDDMDEPPAAARWRLAVQGLFPLLICVWILSMPGTGRWFIAIVCTAVMLVPVTKTLRELRRRRLLLASAQGSKLAPAAKQWTLAPRSWRDVQSIDVGVTTDDSGCRIVATSHTAAKQTNKGDIVDIEIRCTREQAEALRGRLRAWWRGK